MRDSAGIDMVSADHHGTPVLAVDGATAGVTKRRFSAFGEEFGAPAWPSSREFLNKVADASGYVHVEAREYDPALGRFLSVDPIADFTDSQQINGYAYANNNPLTYSDPTGLIGFGCGAICGGAGLGDLIDDLPSSGGGSTGGSSGGPLFPGAPSSATRPDWMNDFLAKGIAARQAQAQRFDSTKKKDSRFGKRLLKELTLGYWGSENPAGDVALQVPGFTFAVKEELWAFAGASGHLMHGFGTVGGAVGQLVVDAPKDLTLKQRGARAGIQAGLSGLGDATGGKLGGFLGAWLGGSSGAAGGSVVPVAGTTVGGLTGVRVGAAVGRFAGAFGATAFLNAGFGTYVDTHPGLENLIGEW